MPQTLAVSTRSIVTSADWKMPPSGPLGPPVIGRDIIVCLRKIDNPAQGFLIVEIYRFVKKYYKKLELKGLNIWGL